MEDANSSPPPESPTSLRDRMICELDALLESLNLTALPLERDLKGDVKFVELFKEYDIGDFSDEEIEEGEIAEEKEDLGSILSAWRRRRDLTPSKTNGDAVAILSNTVIVADLEEAHGRFGRLTPL
ncbi:hypothetical protein Tco_0837239 [Tanacetum coccineum]